MVLSVLSHSHKRRKLNSAIEQTSGDDPSSETEAQPIDIEEFSHSAAKWNLEQEYERKPRKRRDQVQNLRLPIKTTDGRIERAPALPSPPADNDSETSSVVADTNGLAEADASDHGAPPQLSQREQVVQAKEELAKLASHVNENPEENVGSLNALARITSSHNSAITKLGLVTQLAVYRDIIPGYRIRPLTEADMKEKISKEVRRLRNFEQAVVHGYQQFVQELGRIAALNKDGASQESLALASVAVSCACRLLNSVPHFNFRGELLKIIVDKLARGSGNAEFGPSCSSLEQLFASDEEGNASLEAVSMLSKMIKAKHFHVHERVLNTFLHLRLLSEFSHKASNTKVDRNGGELDPKHDKKPKDKREFRTKKFRKQLRERKAIEKEMKEADAIVGHEEHERVQAETLKLVFSIYLRVLKARTPSLMGPVLEGLVKYAHLINQDFFGDLLESLRELIVESDPSYANAEAIGQADADMDFARNATRESLLCVITAFALLQGQDAAKAASSLHLDLSFFITHLYRTLYPASLNADIELSANKKQHLPDPDQTAEAPASKQTKVDVQTSAVLLLRSLNAVLLPTNARSVPPARLAAFTKQLMTALLQLPEKSSTALLGLLNQVAKMHRRKIAALWNTDERRGNGVFDALASEVERSNPFAATVWEGELLRLHYAPAVRDGAKDLQRQIAQQWQS